MLNEGLDDNEGILSIDLESFPPLINVDIPNPSGAGEVAPVVYKYISILAKEVITLVKTSCI